MLPADLMQDEHTRRREEAGQVIARLANPALQAFQPRFYFGPPEGSLTVDRFLFEVPLYAMCCAEFYNHMVENAAYATCANETCDQTFVRQTHRAVKGQHRSHGVLYCSFGCAHMQNQRTFRRRKAAQRKGATTRG